MLEVMLSALNISIDIQGVSQGLSIVISPETMKIIEFC